MHDNEKQVITSLEKKKKQSLEELIESTKLNRDAVSTALANLADQAYVSIEEKTSEGSADSLRLIKGKFNLNRGKNQPKIN